MDWSAVSGSPNSFAPRSAAYPVGAGLLLPEPPGFAGRIIFLLCLFLFPRLSPFTPLGHLFLSYNCPSSTCPEN